MGTCYYVKGEPPCQCCGRPYAPVQIGKHSGGWEFTFRAHASLDLVSRKAWEERLARPDTVIEDEYGKAVSPEDFWKMVDASRAKRKVTRNLTVESGEYRDEGGWSFLPYEFW